MDFDRSLTALGSATLRMFGGLGTFSRFTGDSFRAVGSVRTWLPLLVGQMRRLGVDSLPIALFLAMFTGIVLALQASYTFTGAIPLYFVGTLVEKTMVLELGPVLTGLALSGRIGANIAAELGTMRVSEQIDALETMAYDPIAYLVVPRVAAGFLMFPIIVVFADVVAVLFGLVTSMALLHMSPQTFIRGARLFYRHFDLIYSVIKGFSFGLVITLIGCYQGFNTRGGAEGVGISTTRAVVVAGMLILVLDAFWAATILK